MSRTPYSALEENVMEGNPSTGVGLPRGRVDALGTRREPAGSTHPALPARAPRRRASVQQPELLRSLDRLRAVARAYLLVQRARVVLDRVRRQDQALGNLPVRLAGGHHFEHLALAL